MKRMSKRLTLNLLLLVAVPTMTLASQSRSRSAIPPEDPHEGTTLLIKAFVVRVNLQSLYALGASPLDLGDRPVSVADLQTCLKEPSDAQVIAGKRIAVGHRSEIESSQRATVYRDRSTDPTKPHFNSYDTSIKFTATASLQSKRRVSVEYAWNHSLFLELEDSPHQPPSTSNRTWSGGIYLDLDTPHIVGSVQNEEIAIFLVMSAHLQSAGSPQDAASKTP